MQTYKIYYGVRAPGVSVWGGLNYYVRARWALDDEVLNPNSSIPPTPATYFENAEVYVAAETTEYSAIHLHCDPAWWEEVRGTRNLFAVLEWREAAADSDWDLVDKFLFIVNHDPIANAGPDQLVPLDATGVLGIDLRLEGTATTDPDLDADLNPDPGPLDYSWWPQETPLSIEPDGIVGAAAYGLPNDPHPTLLPAGTVILPGDRGAYTFRLFVSDSDIADIGLYQGQPGTHYAETRVLLGVGGPQLSIDSPTTNQPYLTNAQDGVAARIYYSIGDTIANDPAYAGAWVVKCTIRMADSSPLAPSTLTGTIVHEETKVSFQRVNYFIWDGRMSTANGASVYGSFGIELELLDRDWNSTGVPGSVVAMPRAIVIDPHRWHLPIDSALIHTVLSGGFMESAHAGDFGTRLHTGIDITNVQGGTPELTSVRSGFYTRNGAHDIRIRHAPPDTTRYLHGRNPAPYANDALVLQGSRLATMSDVGIPGSVHLHFEHHVAYGDDIVNPLGIIPLRDEVPPEINATSIRAAAAAGDPASLGNDRVGIGGRADLIVRCRDRAHPDRDSLLDNGPFEVSVAEYNGVTLWTGMRFDSMTAENHLREFFALQGQHGSARTAANHYLAYLRWDTTPYGRTESPLHLEITVRDFGGLARTHTLKVGPEVSVTSMLPVNASTGAANIPISVNITNRCEGLDGIANDNFHAEVVGAPAGWTVTPPTTGNVANGATVSRVLTVHPNGNTPVATHHFQLGIYSNVLTNVGVRVAVSVRIT